MKLQDVLDEANVPYLTEGHHHCRPGWLQLDCPFCSPASQSWRMGYRLAGGYFHCWVCGKHGLTKTLAELIGKSEAECRKLVGQFDEVVERAEKKPRTGLKLPEGLCPLLKAHKDYLRERGFDWRELRKVWDIRGIGISATLPWRLFIPIYLDNQMVSWTTRTVSATQRLRYVSASPNQEAVDHKTLLYGEDYCKHAILVHEGPTDVWRVGPGAVCTFGTTFSSAQVLRISKYPVRYICYDSQPEAQQRARQLCDALCAFPGETINITLDAKDAGSASRREVKALRRLVNG